MNTPTTTHDAAREERDLRSNISRAIDDLPNYRLHSEQIDRILQAFAPATPPDQRVREALQRAIGWFEEYARLHDAKGTHDGHQKAKANSERADDLRAALAAAVEG